ncbi:sensor histidine kinase [Spirochaeta africana]|uniref:histidine kinase n=1 Tax=Spirochaeta africana (strain ATCC 700263 / DSM 8902 / Z-7692) TaxID=889378 RepID=H9UG16_SPIAZ|nr:HAMP domain-containing sensor histidine kinase [Spirochaeta africana]AFG36459.1 signal transduction histidine kinase [Spirochaeta africana DSM 8902]
MQRQPTESIQPELNDRNSGRIIAAARIGGVVSAVHVAVFLLRLETDPSVTRQWQLLIISAHTVMMLLFAVWGTAAWRLRIQGSGGRGIPLLSHSIYLAILLIGSAIAAFDQLVTSAITPFLVGNVVAGLLLTIPALPAAIYHLAAFAVFAFLIPLFQANPAVVLSNQVNGITAAGLGMLLSGTLWRSTRIRLQQEQQIRQQNASLEEAVATRDRFLSIVSHDLRSPLSGFLGLTQYLADERDHLTQTQLDKIIHSLHISAEMLYQLLENLLTWSQSQQGMIRVEAVPVNLQTALQKNIDTYAVAARQSNISLQLNCPAHLEIRTDPHMLDTIVRNLLSNALKHTPGGGNIRLAVQQHSNEVRITCQDSGSGMSAGLLSSLFDLDKQTIAATSGSSIDGIASGSIGSGLGLILCHDFIERLGGQLSVASREGQGSSFSFNLPLDMA